MNETKPRIRPSEVRQTVKELVAMGCIVDWNTVTGQVRIEPPVAQRDHSDPFSQIDYRA